MTNPNDPAFLTKPEVYYLRQPEDKDCDVQYGLTKREYFAALAMQGLLSGETSGFHYEPDESRTARELCAIDAIAFADALIAELNKEAK